MTTPNHPFYSDRHGGFIEAEELFVGDTLRLSNGQVATVTNLVDECALPGESFTTYNFAVAEHHTYFVGQSAVWVHNTGNLCDTLTDKFLELKKQSPEGTSNAELFRRLKEAAPSLADNNYSDAQIAKHLEDAKTKLKAAGYDLDAPANPIPAGLKDKLNNDKLVKEVEMRKGVEKAGDVKGDDFRIKLDEERDFATKMLKAGARVFRSNQTENIGDFIIIYKGKAYGVELGPPRKTKKQLRDLFEKIAPGLPKLTGTPESIMKEILGE